MIAARILPAGISVFEAATVARADNARIFLAPGGQVVIAHEQRPGWQRLHAAGNLPRRLRGYTIDLFQGFLLCCVVFFYAGFLAGWLVHLP